MHLIPENSQHNKRTACARAISPEDRPRFFFAHYPLKYVEMKVTCSAFPPPPPRAAICPKCPDLPGTDRLRGALRESRDIGSWHAQNSAILTVTDSNSK